MKKIVALLLALVILSSLTLTALAAGEKSGSTTISVTVPNPLDAYTIKIPANKELVYGDTSEQVIGMVSVSDVNVPTGKRIVCDIITENLKNGSATIPVTYQYNGAPMMTLTMHDESSTYDDNGGYLYAKVSSDAWAAAAPGTYTATITFNFSIQ